MAIVWVHWGTGDAHALARAALSRHAGAADWRFEPGPYGKPAVAGRWRFNLSRAPGIVAVAVAEGVEVGLDAEDTTREGDFAGVAERWFAPSERAMAFWDAWTLKEAYLKARGTGLRIPLDSFRFDGLSLHGNVGVDWTYAQHRPTARHVLAVVACAPGADVRWEGAV